MDADLQDPPEVITTMLDVAEKLRVDVVYGVRSDRSTDTRFKRWTAHAFYSLIGRLTGGTVRHQSGDFRLMSRPLVEAVNTLPETGRVIRFVVPALGFPSADVAYRRERRGGGRTKYGVGAMMQLSLDSITGVSTAPLRVATYVGLIGGLLALMVGTGTVVAHFMGRTLPGWTSTVAIVSGFSALQLLCLGILGEYIGRTYALLQRRPAYVVEFDSLSDGGDTAAPEPDVAGGLRAATSTEEPKGSSRRLSTYSSS
jgi:dolichol-phosphate mannosyltransferase